jgi:hypothetical protein
MTWQFEHGNLMDSPDTMHGLVLIKWAKRR